VKFFVSALTTGRQHAVFVSLRALFHSVLFLRTTVLLCGVVAEWFECFFECDAERDVYTHCASVTKHRHGYQPMGGDAWWLGR